MSTFETMPGMNLWTVSYEIDDQPPWKSAIGSTPRKEEQVTGANESSTPYVQLVMQFVPSRQASKQSESRRNKFIHRFCKLAFEDDGAGGQEQGEQQMSQQGYSQQGDQALSQTGSQASVPPQSSVPAQSSNPTPLFPTVSTPILHTPAQLLSTPNSHANVDILLSANKKRPASGPVSTPTRLVRRSEKLGTPYSGSAKNSSRRPVVEEKFRKYSGQITYISPRGGCVSIIKTIL